MNEFSRRALLGGAAAAAASTILNEPVHAQYVWQKPDWQAAEFTALTQMSRRIKQVVHAHDIGGGRFLSNIKNSLNGLLIGAGVPANQIQIACMLNGPANALNFGDYIWEKYHVGEYAKITDPKTKEPAVRNIFYPSKAGPTLQYASDDPSNEESAFQDTSIQGLQARGVKFLCCHSATEEQARAFIKQLSLSVQPEEVVKDIHAHSLPGVLIVPAASAALAPLQGEGHYSYMFAG